MPITGDAAKVKKSMTDQYGKEKGERVFYATANKQSRTPETWEKKKALEALGSKVAATIDNAAAPRPTRAPVAPKAKTPVPAPASKLAALRVLGKRAADALKGGMGDGMPDSAFNPVQLSEGIQTEMAEHTNDPGVAKEIAKDHLAEEQMPPQEQEYYTELEEMEEDLAARPDPMREQLVAQNMVKMAREFITDLGDMAKTAMSKRKRKRNRRRARRGKCAEVMKTALPSEGYNSLPNSEIPGLGTDPVADPNATPLDTSPGNPPPNAGGQTSPAPGMLDRADSAIRGGMGAVGDAVGNLHAGTGQLIKDNPYIAGGIGLGAAGLGAYGLYKLLSDKKKKRKSASELEDLGLKVAAEMGMDAMAQPPQPPQPPQGGGGAGQPLTMAPQQGPVDGIPGVEPPQQLVPAGPGGAPGAPAGGQPGRPAAGTPNPATGAQPAQPQAPQQAPQPGLA
jgi:hypothetical protein